MERAARDAGAAAMHYFRRGESIHHTIVRDKGEDNPLGQADLAANDALSNCLRVACPDYGWLSEETLDDPHRLSCPRVWVVDPIDGTREFLRGLPQFAVSIGLVEHGLPIAGCIYNPALEEMFLVVPGSEPTLNGCPVRTTSTGQLSGASVLASHSETDRGEWGEPFCTHFQLTQMGSIAYKLALIAAGRFDLSFTLTPKNEWDVCAGVALVQAGGGLVTSKTGSPLWFNRPEPSFDAILASNGVLHAELVRYLAPVPLSPGRCAPGRPGH